jgi:ATP-binding cassette, subfamily B, bacterial
MKAEADVMAAEPSKRRGGLQAGRRVWERVAPYYGGTRRILVGLAATSIVTGFSEAGMLYLIVRAAVAIAAGEGSVDIQLGPIGGDHLSLGIVLGTALGLLLLRTALAVIEAVLTARITVATLRQARRKVLSDFLGASWAVQSLEREGRLQELLSTHVTRIAAGATMISNGLVAFFNFVAVLGSAVLLSPAAAGLCFVGAAVAGLALRPLMWRTKRYSHEFAIANNEYTARVAETVRLAQEIQVFNIGTTVAGIMNKRVDESVRPLYRTRFVGRLAPNLYQSAALVLVVVCLTVVWVFEVGDATQLGAVVLLLLRALTYSQAIQATVQQAKELAPYIDQLADQYALYQSSARPTGGEPMGEAGSIQFEDVSFNYVPDVPVLQSVSFELKPGEVIGVVGPSGSGKSTLVQLLLRLREPVSGSYTVDGSPAAVFSGDDFSRRFAYVPQDNKLLLGTVSDNIRFYRDSISDEDVEQACRLAHVHDEIMELTDGYATVIGPGAVDLSGGQRQRIGLARALVCHPSVLVLDEPTSALDLRSESLVQQTLVELKGGPTLVVIAHRLSTLTICDRIMVLRNGLLEAIGPARQVLEENAFFRQAMELSQGGFQPVAVVAADLSGLGATTTAD